METINISSLKARLSEVLKRVRKGAVVQVLDRDNPIAVISAFFAQPFVVTEAQTPKFQLPKSRGINIKADPLEHLMKERSRR